MAKVIHLGKEPIVGCGGDDCNNDSWYLICNPDVGKVPRKILAFECTNCGFRVKTDITMEDFRDINAEIT